MGINSISIAQFAIMFVTPAFMKKFGKTAVYEAGMVVMGLGFLGFAVLGGSSTIVMIVCNVLKGCGVGMAGGMALGMVADTITYGTKKTGIDTVGLEMPAFLQRRRSVLVLVQQYSDGF